MSTGSDFAGAVGTAGNMLKGAADTQLKNRQLNIEQDTSAVNYLKDASGKAIDFMSDEQNRKAKLMQEQMIEEAAAQRQKTQIVADQQVAADKLNADKAKHDYENFVTITPEIADGLFKTTGGRLDFKKQVGTRVMTKILIPMIQVSGREEVGGGKGSGGRGQKDLNALKVIISQYNKLKKAVSDPLRMAMAARSPQAKQSLDADIMKLRQMEPQYKEAMDAVSETGNISPAKEDIAIPPPTSQADIDALIDAATPN